MRAAAADVAADRPDRPRFHIGLDTGVAVVGNAGTAEQHSSTAIGDTVNTAARVQGLACSGEVLGVRRGVAPDRRCGGRRAARPGRGQGKREAVELHRLERLI